jgi:hypothetical protein
MYVPVVAALILLVIMLGGPSEVLRVLELTLSSLLLNLRDTIARWL